MQTHSIILREIVGGETRLMARLDSKAERLSPYGRIRHGVDSMGSRILQWSVHFATIPADTPTEDGDAEALLELAQTRGRPLTRDEVCSVLLARRLLGEGFTAQSAPARASR